MENRQLIMKKRKRKRRRKKSRTNLLTFNNVNHSLVLVSVNKPSA
jgi:hypothetical protein